MSHNPHKLDELGSFLAHDTSAVALSSTLGLSDATFSCVEMARPCDGNMAVGLARLAHSDHLALGQFGQFPRFLLHLKVGGSLVRYGSFAKRKITLNIPISFVRDFEITLII